MPRAQNAHAYVNAGFLFKLNVNNGGKVLAKPTIVYGGINPQFVSIIVVVVVVVVVVIIIIINCGINKFKLTEPFLTTNQTL